MKNVWATVSIQVNKIEWSMTGLLFKVWGVYIFLLLLDEFGNEVSLCWAICFSCVTFVTFISFGLLCVWWPPFTIISLNWSLLLTPPQPVISYYISFPSSALKLTRYCYYYYHYVMSLTSYISTGELPFWLSALLHATLLANSLQKV